MLVETSTDTVDIILYYIIFTFKDVVLGAVLMQGLLCHFFLELKKATSNSSHYNEIEYNIKLKELDPTLSTLFFQHVVKICAVQFLFFRLSNKLFNLLGALSTFG